MELKQFRAVIHFFSAVHSKFIELSPPFVIPSKYGGQVIFTMPGGNLIYTHLKDKVKIRHRKRWSQVSNGVKI